MFEERVRIPNDSEKRVGRRSTRPPVAGCREASHGLATRARFRARARSISCVAGLLLAWGRPALAAESEEQVKAAFLVNFARYVEWPEAAFDAATSPIRLCLLGDGEFETILASTVSGREVAGRPVAVARIDDLGAAADCHLLFLREAVGTPGRIVARRLGGRAIFTISDLAGFAAEGGIANFVLVDQKIRFEINPTAARSAGLKIGSTVGAPDLPVLFTRPVRRSTVKRGTVVTLYTTAEGVPPLPGQEPTTTAAGSSSGATDVSTTKKPTSSPPPSTTTRTP